MPITAIISKIQNRQATVGVIGLGYVARPLDEASHRPSFLKAICLAVGWGLQLVLCGEGFRIICVDVERPLSFAEG